MATTKTVGEQIAEYKAKIKELEDKHLDELQEKKAGLEKQLEAVQSEIDAILPPMRHPASRAKRSNSKGPKAEGVKVSASRLEELIKSSGGTLKLRGGKDDPAYDLETIRELVQESKGKLVIGGNKPWYTVSHAK